MNEKLIGDKHICKRFRREKLPLLGTFNRKFMNFIFFRQTTSRFGCFIRARQIQDFWILIRSIKPFENQICTVLSMLSMKLFSQSDSRYANMKCGFSVTCIGE